MRLQQAWALALPLAAARPQVERNGPPNASQVCSFVRSEITAYHEQSAATSFCSSYLSIKTVSTTSYQTHTATATSLATKYVTDFTTPVATTTVFNDQTATAGVSTTTTTTTSTVTEVNPTNTCYTGSGNVKRGFSRRNPNKEPHFAQGRLPQWISSGCSCLDIPTPTTTITKQTTVTQTVPATVSSTVDTAGSVTSYVTNTVVTVVATVPSSTSTSTVTATATAYGYPNFQIVFNGGSGLDGPLYATELNSGAPYDWVTFSGAPSGETRWFLNRECQLISSFSGHAAQQKPGSGSPAQVFSGSGVPVTCVAGVSDSSLDCTSPNGGSQPFICNYDITTNQYHQWYLGDDTSPGTNCFPISYHAAFTGGYNAAS